MLQLAGDFFESAAGAGTHQLYALQKKNGADTLPALDPGGILGGSGRVATAATPRTSPLPLNGRFLTIDGPADVKVTDSSGNRIGVIDNASDLENPIPGASYQAS